MKGEWRAAQRYPDAFDRLLKQESLGHCAGRAADITVTGNLFV
jgi:hypothetical protein